MTDTERFGRVLKRLRVAKGWRQVDLAKRAKLSQGNLSGIEAGTYDARWSTACKLADALGVDISEFRGEVEDDE